MCHRGVGDSQGVPQPGHGEVRAHEQRTSGKWAEVDDVVLQWVAVYGGDSNGCCPLVVGLMDVLVETGVVE